MSDHAEYYDGTKKSRKILAEEILKAMQEAGICGHIVKGALSPTIEVNIEKRRLKDGTIQFAQYVITID